MTVLEKGELREGLHPHGSRSLAKIGWRDNIRLMRDLLVLAVHLLVTFTKLLRPGGTAPPRRPLLMLRLIRALGGRTVAVYFRSQSLLKYEIATGSR